MEKKQAAALNRGLDSSIRRPYLEVWSLYVLAVSIPLFGITFSIGANSSLHLSWMCIILFVSLVVVALLLGQQTLKLDSVGKAVLFLNVTATFSIVNLFNTDYQHFYDFCTTWLQLILVSLMFFCISSLEIKISQVKQLFKLWVLIATLISLYAIYQAAARNLGLPLAYLPFAEAAGTFGEYTRPSSIFAEPSYLGSYLLAPLLLLSCGILFKKDQYFVFSNSRWNKVIVVIIFSALILSFSLAAYVTAAGVCFILVLNREIRKPRARMFKIYTGMLIGAMLVIAILSFFNIDFASSLSRVQSIYNQVTQGTFAGSFGTRLARLVVTLKVWLEHPILGVGLNNVHYSVMKYGWRPEWYTGVGHLAANHNVWAQALAEMGIPGFLALVTLWGSALKKIKKTLSLARGTPWEAILCGFYCIIWSDIINSNFTHMFMHPQRWFDLSLTSLTVYVFHKYTKQVKDG